MGQTMIIQHLIFGYGMKRLHDYELAQWLKPGLPIKSVTVNAVLGAVFSQEGS